MPSLRPPAFDRKELQIVVPPGIEPELDPYEESALPLSYGTMVAQPGVEPGTGTYEAPEIPFLYRANPL